MARKEGDKNLSLREQRLVAQMEAAKKAKAASDARLKVAEAKNRELRAKLSKT